MLADAAGAGEDDADVRFRHIDAFIEHLARHQDRIFAAAETLKDVSPFLRFRLVRDGRHQQTAGDLVHGRIVGGENENAVAAMLGQEGFQLAQFRRGSLGDPFLLAESQEGGPALRRAIRLLKEALPAGRAADADAAFLDEMAVLVAGLLIALGLLRGKIDVTAFDAGTPPGSRRPIA